MMTRLSAGARRLVLETLGWLLVLTGVAALVLPGPGLLALFAGLLVLSQQYEWAERRVEPVKRQALKAAHDGVKTWLRVVLSALGALSIVAVGVVWGLRPPAPSWWPVREGWWLLGGWGTGATLVASGVFALGLLGYSVRAFRGAPTPDSRPAGRTAAPRD